MPRSPQTGPEKPKKTGKVDFDLARERARQANSYWGPVQRAITDDLQWIAGHHWTAAERKERGKDRITLTINDFGQYLDQVIGDIRQNPASINVIPSDLAAERAKFTSNTGRKYDGKEVISGLVRQIEYKSTAQEHYELAGQHAAEAGLGYLRLYTAYSDTGSFNQDIRVERIKNRLSVLMDPMATEPDGSDQNFCFVGDWMHRDEFRKITGSADAPTSITQAQDKPYWSKENYVRVTEYYWREEIEYEIAQLDNGQIITDGSHLTGDEKEDAERVWELAEAGGRIERRRKVQSYRVKWAKISYHQVIEGPYTLPGTVIPVAPVYGKRIEGDEDTVYYGLFRFAKEPKKMEEYWLSAATERVAMMPKMPWLLSTSMIEGHENYWNEANVGNKPYLLYNDMEGGAKPDRLPPPTLAAGEMQMFSAMRETVKGSIGQHDASIGKATNQQSGRALIQLERSADVGNFVFADNLRMAISYMGRCMLEWIPVIYDVERAISIRHANGEVDTIEINRGNGDNDIKSGRYEHHVTTGPAYSTLRQQAADQQLRLYELVPDIAKATLDLTLGNMDWPGADLMARRVRKMVPRELLDENELTEEEKGAEDPPPNPEQQVQMAEAQADMAEAEADMALADAKKSQAEATVVKSEAEIANVATSAARNVAQQANGATQPAPSGQGQPVTMQDLENLKNEIAQMIARSVPTTGATQ